MNDIHWCICGQRATELHHRVFRSQCKPLEHCKMNLIPLCRKCHYSIHHGNGTEGNKLNKLLKLEFQNKLEIMFDKERLTEEEIKEVLGISEKALQRLLKPIQCYRGMFYREEVIRACMGGKLLIKGSEK